MCADDKLKHSSSRRSVIIKHWPEAGPESFRSIMRRASDTLANITVFVLFFSPLLVVANYEQKTGLAETDVLLFFFSFSRFKGRAVSS